MVNCCVNPACGTEFRLVHSGDLYAIDRPYTDTEFFWICSNCSSRFDLALDSMGRLLLRPREDSQPAYTPPFPARLRLVARARRHMPWRHAVPAGIGPMADNSGGWGSVLNGAHL
jgi:hypothetical protein